VDCILFFSVTLGFEILPVLGCRQESHRPKCHC